MNRQYLKDKDGLLWFRPDPEEEVKDTGSFVDEDGNISHIQNVTPLMRDCEKLKKESPSGMASNRALKRLGSIPYNIILQHPHLMFDDKALMKWFRDNPEYMSSEETFGKKGKQIIVK